MNRIKYIFALMLSVFMLTNSNQLSIAANETNLICEIQSTIRSDKIIVKHRLYNGKYQHRRWNKSKHKWVDPSWIDD